MLSAFLIVNFTGANASAAPVAIAVPEVKAGDTIIRITEKTPDGFGSDPEGGNGSIFAWFVLKDGEIIQRQLDLSGATFTAVLIRITP